jgi:hypothetical protein
VRRMWTLMSHAEAVVFRWAPTFLVCGGVGLKPAAGSIEQIATMQGSIIAVNS